MIISQKEVGRENPTYVIAEIGINHNGSIDTAKRLIDAAVDCGVDAVKFQKRTIEVVYTESELAKPRESPFGTTNGDLKRGLEFGINEYSEIDDYCHEKIMWFASPWDCSSVDFLENFDIPSYKVASACITDLNLLQRIKQTEKPVIVSTGMSTEEQIGTALEVLRPEGDLEDIALLSCTSTYPAKLEELNLNKINALRETFGTVVGYSGHEVGLWTTLCAVAMGAAIVERHITLDRSMWGSDQSASIEPGGFKKLVTEIRDFEKAKGDGLVRILASELPMIEKLRRFK